jgi:hypothetical protein
MALPQAGLSLGKSLKAVRRPQRCAKPVPSVSQRVSPPTTLADSGPRDPRQAEDRARNPDRRSHGHRNSSVPTWFPRPGGSDEVLSHVPLRVEEERAHDGASSYRSALKQREIPEPESSATHREVARRQEAGEAPAQRRRGPARPSHRRRERSVQSVLLQLPLLVASEGDFPPRLQLPAPAALGRSSPDDEGGRGRGRVPLSRPRFLAILESSARVRFRLPRRCHATSSIGSSSRSRPRRPERSGSEPPRSSATVCGYLSFPFGRRGGADPLVKRVPRPLPRHRWTESLPSPETSPPSGATGISSDVKKRGLPPRATTSARCFGSSSHGGRPRTFRPIADVRSGERKLAQPLVRPRRRHHYSESTCGWARRKDKHIHGFTRRHERRGYWAASSEDIPDD